VLVKAGTILFQIDPAPYEAKVKQLQAAVAEASQKVKQLKAQVELAVADCATPGRRGLREFNAERPHEALAMKCPAELYTASARSYAGLPELTYPFHDRDVVITACGRLCLHRKRINISTVLAGQKLGIKEVDEAIWLASFMHYNLGYFDLEQKTLQPLDNPFGTRLSPLS
jgi:hypothetical protein